MVRTKLFVQKICLFITAFTLLSSPVFAKKKKTDSKSSAMVQDTYTKDAEPVALPVQEETVPEIPASDDVTQVKLPSAKRTFFSKIDSSIIKSVEKGSPSSLKDAMSKIRKNESDYVDNEKVLIAIATEILKTVWPSEKQTWDSFEADTNNPYMGAIQSAQDGIFDSSTGNTDFLATILPAFVIFNSGFNPADTDSCKKAVTQALASNSDSVLANYMMGLLLEKNKEYTESLRYYKKAYEADAPSQELSLAYVRMLRQTGDVSKASTVMATLPSDSLNIEVLKQNAYVAFASNNLSLAEQYVARVLQQTPNDLDFVLFRAKILVEKKDYIHAVSLLDMYSRQNDTNVDYLNLRAQVQFDWSKNTSAATETVEKALQLYPDNLQSLMLAAKISSATDAPVAGKYADELSAKVIEKDPDNAEALSYALKGLAQRENWKEAYEISKKLIQKENVSSEIVEKYVQICVKLGRKSEAFDYAKRMYDLNPEDELLLQSYILAYSEVGARDTVLKYIDSLMPSVSAKMKSYLYYRRSFLQYSEENSLADLRSSLISNPRNSDALFRLYEIYYAKKDYRKAQYYLRQVVAINPNDSSVKKLNEALTKLIQ